MPDEADHPVHANADRRWHSARHRLVQLAPAATVFVPTAVALGVGTGVTVAAAWPAALFGLALSAFMLRRWSERLVVAIASGPVYWGAVQLVGLGFDRFPAWAFAVLGYMPSAVLGAVAMCSLVAVWDSNYWRAIPLAAGMGVIAGVVFPLVAVGSSSAVAHVVWQVLVGCALVDYGMRKGTVSLTLSSAGLRDAAATGAIALLIVGGKAYLPLPVSPGSAAAANDKAALPAAPVPAIDAELGRQPDAVNEPAIDATVAEATGAGLPVRQASNQAGAPPTAARMPGPGAARSTGGDDSGTAALWELDATARLVREVICTQLGCRPRDIKPTSRLVEDLGADSLDQLDLILAYEEVFEIEVTRAEEDMLSCERSLVSGRTCLSTAEDVVRFIRRRWPSR